MFFIHLDETTFHFSVALMYFGVQRVCAFGSCRNLLAERCPKRNGLSHQVDLHHILICAS